MTPTARSMKYMRQQGMNVGVVERYNCFTRRRSDLFGFIDLVAVGNSRTVGVQTTTKQNMNARIKKIIGECSNAALDWIRVGNIIEVHGWYKDGKRWQVESVQLHDYDIDKSVLDSVTTTELIDGQRMLVTKPMWAWHQGLPSAKNKMLAA